MSASHTYEKRLQSPPSHLSQWLITVRWSVFTRFTPPCSVDYSASNLTTSLLCHGTCVIVRPSVVSFSLPAEATTVLFSASSLSFSVTTITHEPLRLAKLGDILHEHVPWRLLEAYWISRFSFFFVFIPFLSVYPFSIFINPAAWAGNCCVLLLRVWQSPVAKHILVPLM